MPGQSARGFYRLARLAIDRSKEPGAGMAPST
jgi:hypothetical protein